MIIDKDKLTDKANQLSGQAKELLSKVDTEKAMRVTDRFMAGVFKFGKIVAALFMFLSILTMVGSLIYYVFSGASSIKIPDFNDVKAAEEAKEKGAVDSDSGVSNKEFSEVRAKYSTKVEKLIELCKLDADKDFTSTIKRLCRIRGEYRSDYINGAISFVKDWKQYLEKAGKEKFTGETGRYMLDTYGEMFLDAIKAAKESEEMSALKRTTALGTCGGALLALILFLIIPLLLQIEENTRK